MTKVVINGCFGGFGLSEEACKFLGIEYGYEFNNDRTNPRLIECVETLGSKASDCFAQLIIDEYDEENFDYYIDEYDGLETLCTIPGMPR